MNLLVALATRAGRFAEGGVKVDAAFPVIVQSVPFEGSIKPIIKRAKIATTAGGR